MANDRIYIAVDLKSFYASVECKERGLDPLTTNLVVADASRTEKTICLAVSPSLKAHGISGRARLFEVVQKVREANARRLSAFGRQSFHGSSYDASELASNPDLAIDYIAAPPRMSLYMKYSTRIYSVYLKHAAPEDIHVYSIDEVFIDVTSYLHAARMSARDFAKMLIQDVFETTGITATAGIGTNLYLAKVAMDIVAKHVEPDRDGVRIARLDEMTYRRVLWSHRPLTDFWRVGKGYAAKLEAHGLYTMGDIARCSLGKQSDYYNEDLLYQMFGINAELLIDHAWGWEPCTIADVKTYKPESSSIGSGQVLHCPYTYEQTRLVIREMADLLSLNLVDKRLVTNQLVLTVGYDIENLSDPKRRKSYTGAITTDHYGRQIPKHAHGTANLKKQTSSTRLITNAVMELYERIINKELLIRRIYLTATHVADEQSAAKEEVYEQLNLFTDFGENAEKKEQELIFLEKEKKMQEAMLNIKKKYGKNAILKGMNLQEGATTVERNRQIGGHKA